MDKLEKVKKTVICPKASDCPLPKLGVQPCNHSKPHKWDSWECEQSCEYNGKIYEVEKCQLFEPKVISALDGQAYLETVCFKCPTYSQCEGSNMEDCMRRDNEPKSDESRLLTHKIIDKIFSRQDLDDACAKTASIKDAENKELGLLLESRVGGIDKINDWSERGLRTFREKIMPLIKEHCKKLKAGNLGILHEYLDKKEAESQKRVERIFKAVKEYFKNEPWMTEEDWQALKKQEGYND